MALSRPDCGDTEALFALIDRGGTIAFAAGTRVFSRARLALPGDDVRGRCYFRARRGDGAWRSWIGFSQQLIAKCVLLDYSQDEAAKLLGCWRRTVGRRYPEALDRLSELFLAGGLLKRVGDPASTVSKNLSRGRKRRIPRQVIVQAQNKKCGGHVPFSPSNLIF